MLTTVALAADAVVVGRACCGWIDPPAVIVAVVATFCAIVAWTCKETKR